MEDRQMLRSMTFSILQAHSLRVHLSSIQDPR